MVINGEKERNKVGGAEQEEREKRKTRKWRRGETGGGEKRGKGKQEQEDRERRKRRSLPHPAFTHTLLPGVETAESIKEH